MQEGRPNSDDPGNLLITGAGSGIGRETAMLFSKCGWTVNAGILPGQTAPEGCRGVLLDVTDQAQVSATVATIAERGPIDLLINNAAINPAGSIESLGVAAFRQVLEVNVLGAIATCAEVLPGMRERGGGTIINVGSGMSRAVIPFSACYATSKFALEGFSRALWYEASPLGVSIRYIMLGSHNTGFGMASPDLTHEPTAYHQHLSAMASFATRTLTRAKGPEIAARGIYKVAMSRSRRLAFAVGTDARAARLIGALPFDRVGPMIARAFR